MKKYFLIVTALFFAAAQWACRTDIPAAEMSSAGIAVNGAYTAQSDKYSPELLKEAETDLYGSHDACRDGDEEKAKELALSAKKKADEAAAASWPQASADSLADAQRAFAEAETAGARIFAQEKMTAASELIKKAENFRSTGRHSDSCSASSAAAELALEGKTIALAQIPALSGKAAAAADEAAALENKGVNVSSVKSDLAQASAFIKEGNPGAAWDKIVSAEKGLDKARSGFYSSRISSLKSRLAGMEKDREFAGAQIKGAAAALNSAGAYASQKNWSAADEQIRQAEDKISAAETMIAKGIEKKKADEARAAAEARAEAEAAAAASAAAVSVSAAAEDEEETQAAEVPSDTGEKTNVRYYTVQYHEKDTDCLWRISHKVYRNAALWPKIYMANRDQIKDPDLIFPGQKLVIPEVTDKDRLAAEKRAAKAKKAVSPSGRHRIQSGKKYSSAGKASAAIRQTAGKKASSAQTVQPDMSAVKDSTASAERSSADASAVSGKKNVTGKDFREDELLPEGIFRENQ